MSLSAEKEEEKKKNTVPSFLTKAGTILVTFISKIPWGQKLEGFLAGGLLCSFSGSRAEPGLLCPKVTGWGDAWATGTETLQAVSKSSHSDSLPAPTLRSGLLWRSQQVSLCTPSAPFPQPWRNNPALLCSSGEVEGTFSLLLFCPFLWPLRKNGFQGKRKLQVLRVSAQGRCALGTSLSRTASPSHLKLSSSEPSAGVLWNLSGRNSFPISFMLRVEMEVMGFTWACVCLSHVTDIGNDLVTPNPGKVCRNQPIPHLPPHLETFPTQCLQKLFICLILFI